MSHRDAVDVFCFSHHGGARLRDLKRIAGGGGRERVCVSFEVEA